MKKMILLLFVACLAMAGIEDPYTQFYGHCDPHAFRADQNWFAAQLISLTVAAGSDLYLSNYVRSWYEPIADLDGNVFQMSGSEKYGYINKADILGFGANKADYAGKVHWATGLTTNLTYYNDTTPNLKQTATGYFVDHFDEDSEIYLVMTTLGADGGETVDTYQYVSDTGHDTILQSRQHNTVDLAGNVRINLGINSVNYGYIAREFVAIFDSPEVTPPAGQPLPGLFMSSLIGFGSIGMARFFKKNKKKKQD